MGNDVGKNISIFIVGLGIGAGLGILFAPKSGDETRNDIANAAQDAADQAMAQGADLGRRAQEAVADVQEQVKSAVEVGNQAYREAKSGVS